MTKIQAAEMAKEASKEFRSTVYHVVKLSRGKYDFRTNFTMPTGSEIFATYINGELQK